MKRTSMARICVGDVGVLSPPQEVTPIPPDLDMDTLSTRELMIVALNAGVKLKDLIGVDQCFMHVEYVELGAKALPEGYNLLEHCVWCRNCFVLFRIKRK